MNFFSREPEHVPSLKNDIESHQQGRFGKVKGIFKNKLIDPFSNKANSIAESAQNYQLGIFILFTGVFILGVSLCFFPLIFIKPYKFCAMSSLGTFTIFVSLIVMRGKQLLFSLLSKSKALFTLAFFITFILELYFSLIKEKYIFVLVFFTLHMVSILYISISYIPNGVQFLNASFRQVFFFARAMFGFRSSQTDVLPL